jgi:Family of unknown function (DUF5681)
MTKKIRQPKSQSRSQKPVASPPPYPVGYRRPPVHGQFKSGVSGNPRGRPRGRPNLGTVTRTELDRRVTIREGDRSRRISKVAAWVVRTINGAVNGDPKSSATLINLLRALGIIGEPSDAAGEQANPVVTPEEKEILDAFVEQYLKNKDEKK